MTPPGPASRRTRCEFRSSRSAQLAAIRASRFSRYVCSAYWHPSIEGCPLLERAGVPNVLMRSPTLRFRAQSPQPRRAHERSALSNTGRRRSPTARPCSAMTADGRIIVTLFKHRAGATGPRSVVPPAIGLLLLAMLVTLAFAGSALSAQAKVDLGNADSFGALSFAAMTNAGANTVVHGNIGSSTSIGSGVTHPGFAAYGPAPLSWPMLRPVSSLPTASPKRRHRTSRRSPAPISPG